MAPTGDSSASTPPGPPTGPFYTCQPAANGPTVQLAQYRHSTATAGVNDPLSMDGESDFQPAMSHAGILY